MKLVVEYVMPDLLSQRSVSSYHNTPLHEKSYIVIETVLCHQVIAIYTSHPYNHRSYHNVYDQCYNYCKLYFVGTTPYHIKVNN